VLQELLKDLLVGEKYVPLTLVTPLSHPCHTLKDLLVDEK
jgi:hypothetical protein